MTRVDVTMSGAEVQALIHNATTAILAVADGHGFVVRVVSCTASGTTVSIESESDDHLWAAIELDPRVCLTFEQFPEYAKLRGVVLHGTALLAPATGSSRTISVPITEDVVSFDFGRLFGTR